MSQALRRGAQHSVPTCLLISTPTQQPSPQQGPGRVHLRWGRCPARSGLFISRVPAPRGRFSPALHGALSSTRRGASHTDQRRALSGSCPGSLVWAQDLGKQGRPAKGTIMFPQTHRSIRIHSMHFTRAIKFYMQLSEIPNTANYPPK